MINKRKNPGSRFGIRLASALLAVALSFNSHADDIARLDATTAFYDLETQWVGGIAPGPNDHAIFNLDDDVIVNWDELTTIVRPDVGRLSITNGNVTFQNVDESPQYTLNIIDTSTEIGLRVDGPSTILNVLGLKLNTASIIAITNNATFNLDGNHPSGTNATGILFFSDGAFNITNGATASTNFTRVGFTEVSNAIATVSGTNSTWLTASMFVGSGGDGTLNIQNGGEVSSQLASIIGVDFGATGNVNVNGSNSKLRINDILLIGSEGSGNLNIQDGGRVTSTGSVIGNVFPTILDELFFPTGTVVISGSNSRWDNSGDMIVGNEVLGTINIENGSIVTTNNATLGVGTAAEGVVTVTGNNSRWILTEDLFVANEGDGSILIENGAILSNNNATLGAATFSEGVVTVTGNNSTWNNDNNLIVGVDGDATLTVESGGTVNVRNVTSIGENGNINVTGGHFKFNRTSYANFSKINAQSGSLEGDVNFQGTHDLASLTAFQNTNADLSGVNLANIGTLFGSATLNVSLLNASGGELQTLTGQTARFSGGTNAGEINMLDGLLEFENNFTNQSTGLIAGRGGFKAGQWTNEGTFAISGLATDIFGDFNNTTGSVITTGNATTTFWDDVVHNGSEIRTSEGSSTVFFGSFSGSGNFTGNGSVFFEGDLKPGNSPGTLNFQGDVHLTETNTLTIELGGETPDIQFDQLAIGGAAFLDGNLVVDLINGYIPAPGTTFEILNFDTVSGIFDEITTQNAPLGLFFDIIIDELSGTGTLEAKAHLPGDVNLDGLVNIQDLSIFATNFNSANKSWFFGNFNFDNIVNIQDLALLASNFGKSIQLPEPINANLLSANAIGQASTIPTPSSFSLLGLAGVTLFRRRGRNI